MKFLVCTDGSEYSQRAIEKAALIAEKCEIGEITILHVYDDSHYTAIPFLPDGGISITEEEIESLKKVNERERKEREKLLAKASEYFSRKMLKNRTLLKEGHPSHTIIKVAQEEEIDIIVLGSRGLSGFQKVFLGSVSNAVLHEAKDCSILIVK